MILIAVLALTVFHPGFCFPRLGKVVAAEPSLESGREKNASVSE